jgi:hypothetical protein
MYIHSVLLIALEKKILVIQIIPNQNRCTIWHSQLMGKQVENPNDPGGRLSNRASAAERVPSGCRQVLSFFKTYNFFGFFWG